MCQLLTTRPGQVLGVQARIKRDQFRPQYLVAFTWHFEVANVIGLIFWRLHTVKNTFATPDSK